MKEPFLSALPILQKIESNGYEAYFVGGAIRDLLLNRTISDVDIATSARPEEIKAIFTNTVDVGIEHGTVLVFYNKENYEITTFRAETEYKDYRHPDKVEFIRSLEGDLKRRDFTMNAIAMNQYGELEDPFNGRRDIEDGIIRTVGKADERFHEDALRMMRAVRFVSKLNFNIEPCTEQALFQNASLLKFIAVERMTNEFVKLLNGTAKRKALSLLLQSTLVDYLPGAAETKSSLTKCIHFNIDSLSENQIWLIMLYLQTGDPAVYLKKWRHSNQKIKYLVTCLHALKNKHAREWSIIDLYPLNLEMAIDIETVYRTLKNVSTAGIYKELSNKFNQMVIKSRDELAVSGTDLMRWFEQSPGPWIKKMLNRIEEAVLLRKVNNNKEAIKGWITNRAITNENKTD
ncbi:CCA tRNA nucleotidyltransferase [Bacillus sp. FJAT-49736]|uniref:CCA tRNA nucleotidyltransferase n=1 Tax=Bacillus sp. FJAT-49736 TaxID=2833582 RepID=UPI001BC9DC50|nr:CCA tRNA nucleotidyltransferase [Bacillus sp. FJAT-49736]MBS4173253.1 CCA tRNA nucleotidyltransferase [Bacillus sp. FJAT-49736]